MFIRDSSGQTLNCELSLHKGEPSAQDGRGPWGPTGGHAHLDKQDTHVAKLSTALRKTAYVYLSI